MPNRGRGWGVPRGVWQKTRLFPVFVLCTLPLQQMFAFLSFCLSVAVSFKWECELPAWKSRQLERIPVSRKRNKKSRESNNSELSRFDIALLARLHTVHLFNCMTFWFGESLVWWMSYFTHSCTLSSLNCHLPQFSEIQGDTMDQLPRNTKKWRRKKVEFLGFGVKVMNWRVFGKLVLEMVPV